MELIGLIWISLGTAGFVMSIVALVKIGNLRKEIALLQQQASLAAVMTGGKVTGSQLRALAEGGVSVPTGESSGGTPNGE